MYMHLWKIRNCKSAQRLILKLENQCLNKTIEHVHYSVQEIYIRLLVLYSSLLSNKQSNFTIQQK